MRRVQRVKMPNGRGMQHKTVARNRRKEAAGEAVKKGGATLNGCSVCNGTAMNSPHQRQRGETRQYAHRRTTITARARLPLPAHSRYARSVRRHAAAGNAAHTIRAQPTWRGTQKCFAVCCKHTVMCRPPRHKNAYTNASDDTLQPVHRTASC